MATSLVDKVSALRWIPNGEVDDTRFEKLFDDLASYTSSDSGRQELFDADLLGILQVRQKAIFCVSCSSRPNFNPFLDSSCS